MSTNPYDQADSSREDGSSHVNVVSVPRRSVFLSYASADRAAARRLRDIFSAAGLDVWLDEEELAGGEEWDAKIRQQIRTCTYFVPIISVTTQMRSEGYFRREWRLAVERTLDLADDVLFLIPVVIDDTPEDGARVPERFASVHWLRCPGGNETPSVNALARRLVQHGPAPAAPPESKPPPASDRTITPDRGPIVPPPLPAFPDYPASGRNLYFFYELVVWLGLTAMALWLRLPKPVQIAATIVALVKLIGAVFGRDYFVRWYGDF